MQRAYRTPRRGNGDRGSAARHTPVVISDYRFHGTWSTESCCPALRLAAGNWAGSPQWQYLVGAARFGALLPVELVAPDRGMTVDLLARPHDVAERPVLGR